MHILANGLLLTIALVFSLAFQIMGGKPGYVPPVIRTVCNRAGVEITGITLQNGRLTIEFWNPRSVFSEIKWKIPRTAGTRSSTGEISLAPRQTTSREFAENIKIWHDVGEGDNDSS